MMNHSRIRVSGANDAIAAERWMSRTMEMKRLSGGNLRAAGYDDKNRTLVVELTSGTLQYSGVSAEMWRRFAGASSPWSFYRDNIDEEYPAKRIR
jgi:KTSC domain